jgi:hypothetical protein
MVRHDDSTARRFGLNTGLRPQGCVIRRVEAMWRKPKALAMAHNSMLASANRIDALLKNNNTTLERIRRQIEQQSR